jgi:hypothetical protein
MKREEKVVGNARRRARREKRKKLATREGRLEERRERELEIGGAETINRYEGGFCNSCCLALWATGASARRHSIWTATARAINNTEWISL